jgi:hypothetical protein
MSININQCQSISTDDQLCSPSKALKDRARQTRMDMERSFRQEQHTFGGKGEHAKWNKERSDHRTEVQRLRRMLERVSRGSSRYVEEDDEEEEEEDGGNGEEEEDRVSNISMAAGSSVASSSPDRGGGGGGVFGGHGLDALVDRSGTLQRMMPRLNTLNTLNAGHTAGRGGVLEGLERSGVDLINNSQL